MDISSIVPYTGQQGSIPAIIISLLAFLFTSSFGKLHFGTTSTTGVDPFVIKGKVKFWCSMIVIGK